MSVTVMLFVFVTLSPEVCTTSCSSVHRVPFHNIQDCEAEGDRIRNRLSQYDSYEKIQVACSGLIRST